MSDFVYQDGSEIPDADVAKALQEGRAGVRPGTMLRMLDDAGSPKKVPAEEFFNAVGQGWKYESPDQYELRKYQETAGFTEGAKAVAEGLAKGATVGLSDVALSAIGGDEYREQRAKRDQTFETASTVAEVAGAVAPLLLTGGGSAGAQAGARAGAEAATLGKAALAGAEAASTAKAASTVAKVAEFAPTSLIAKAGTAATGAVERGVGKALQRAGMTGLGGQTLTRGAGMAAGGAVEGALYGAGQGLGEAALAPGGDYDRLAEHVINGAKDGAVFGTILGGGFGAGSELVKGAAQKAFGSGGVKQFLSRVEEKAGEWSLHGLKKDQRTIKRANRGLSEQETSVSKILLDEDVLPQTVGAAATRTPEQTLAKAAELQTRAVKQMDEALAPIRKTMVDATDVAKALDDTIKPLRGKFATASEDAAVNRMYNELAKPIDAITSGKLTLEDVIDMRRKVDGLARWDSTASNEFKDLMKSTAGKVRDLEETLVAKHGGTDALDAYLNGKAKFQAGKIAEETTADWINRLDANRLNSLTDNLSTVGGAVTGMATGSFGLAAATAIAAGAANNFLRKRGMGIVSAMARQMRQAEAVTASKVRKFIRSPIRVTTAAPAANFLGGGAYHEQVGRYNELLRALESASKRPPQLRVVDSQAPRTGYAMRLQEERIRDNILARAPSKRPASDNPLVAKALGYRRPTPSELARFSTYVATANNPEVALLALERGRLTRDHVEALRDNYPHRFDQLKTTVLRELAESGKAPEYAKIVKLGMLLGIPLAPTLDPEHIRISQSVYSAEQQAGSQPKPQKLNINPKKYATQVERIEAGEMDTI